MRRGFDPDLASCLTYVFMLAVIFGALGLWQWFSAANESATYNRLTGAHTTTWDALWVELRVQEGTQK